MKRLVLPIFVVFQCIASSCLAASPYATKAESSASESSGPDGVVQTVANSSFVFTNLYNPQKQNFTDGLIAQKIESTTVSGKGGASPKLEVSAWIGTKSKYDTKLWTINDCADAGWQSGSFYWTSKYGWDGAENMLRAYNLKTGKYTFSFTTDPVFVDIYIPKDVIKRNISYVSRKGAESECRKNEMPKSAIGTLTLSDGESQIDKILFEADEEDLAQSPKIILINDKEAKGTSNLSVWGPADFTNKSEVVKGFAVRLLFRNGKEAIVPLANDKFDIQNSTLPKNIKLHRIEVEKLDTSKS